MCRKLALACVVCVISSALLSTVGTADDDAKAPPEFQGEAKVIVDMLRDSQTQLRKDHNVDAVLALFAEDATMVFGRGEKPGPYDIVFDRPKIGAILRAYYHGKPDGKSTTDLDRWQVDISGDRAVVRYRDHTTSPDLEEIQTRVVHLRKTAGGWKIERSRSWLSYRKRPGQEIRYTPEKWKQLDAEVQRCREEATLYELVAALAEACRFKEAHAEAKEMTEEYEDEAAAWAWRGYTAVALADVEDARRSYRRARTLDPNTPVPNFAKDDLAPPELADPKSFPERHAFCDEQTDKYGYKDADGRVVIPAQYDLAHDFAYGLAPVNQGAKREHSEVKRGGKWGYIDTSGRLVVPFSLDFANEFSDGLAKVSDDRGTRFINPRGETVIKPARGTAGDFREGLAPVYEDRSMQNRDWQTRYIDKRGRTVFSVTGYGEEFHQGRAVLTVSDGSATDNRRCGYIDQTGKTVIPAKFAAAKHFTSGLAAVQTAPAKRDKTEDVWGYIDRQGNYVIRPRFNEAYPFVDGVALVHVGGEYQVRMDAPGYWKSGTWQAIDKTGKVLQESPQPIDVHELAKTRSAPSDS